MTAIFPRPPVLADGWTAEREWRTLFLTFAIRESADRSEILISEIDPGWRLAGRSWHGTWIQYTVAGPFAPGIPQRHRVAITNYVRTAMAEPEESEEK